MLQFLLNDKTQPQLPSQCLHLYSSLGVFASGHWISQNCVWKTSIDLHQACALSASTSGSHLGPLGWCNWSVCTISQVTLRATCLMGAPADPVAASQPDVALNKPSPLKQPGLYPPCVQMLKSHLSRKALRSLQPAVTFAFWNSESLLLFHLAFI